MVVKRRGGADILSVALSKRKEWGGGGGGGGSGDVHVGRGKRWGKEKRGK